MSLRTVVLVLLAAALWAWWRPSTDLHSLFERLDTDEDQRLSLEEFLLFYNPPDKLMKDQSVTLDCTFIPIQMETLSKDLTEASLGMKGLLDWKKPDHNEISVAVSSLAKLLPPCDAKVGYMWYLIPPLVHVEGEYLNSSRYVEQYQTSDVDDVFRNLLTTFHPNVFLQTRFHPRGTLAIVRALNQDAVNILFRCHAEFQLNKPPLLPFWFTPAQFQGNLIISKNGSNIIDFSMSVPIEKKLNVDMEWMNKENDYNMEVDIGFLPKMELSLKGNNINKKHTDVRWDREISFQEANSLLEKKMFPFKQVPYYPLKEALTTAKVEMKFIHSIILWGALDDQSC